MLGYLFSGRKRPDLVLGTAGKVIYGRPLPFEWRPRTESPPANPSLADLSRILEWLFTKDFDGLFAVLSIIMVILSVLTLVIKTIIRSKSRWNLSPLAVAWMTIYLIGDIPFTTISTIFPHYNTVIDIDRWNTLLELMLPLSTPRVASGPTTYALFLCAVWEIGVVLVTTKYTWYGLPKRESFGDWFILIGTLLFTARFTDLAIVLPLVERSGGKIFVEKYESLTSFVTNAEIGALYFMVVPFFVSVTFDVLFCQGMTFSPLEPLPLIKEIKKEVVETTSDERQLTHGGKVQMFFWEQMCTARAQLQILQADQYVPAEDHLDLAKAYRRLKNAYCTLLPLRAALKGMIHLKVAKGQDTSRMMFQQTMLENLIMRAKEQMFYLVSNFDDFKFESERGAPDMDLYERLQAFRRETEQFVLEKKDVEGELETLQDSIRELEERMSSAIPVPSLVKSLEEIQKRERLAREEFEQTEEYVQQALRMLAEREAAERAEAELQLQKGEDTTDHAKLQEEVELTGGIQDDKTDGSTEGTMVEEESRASPEYERFEPNVQRQGQQETPRAVPPSSAEGLASEDTNVEIKAETDTEVLDVPPTVAIEGPVVGSAAAIDAELVTPPSQESVSTHPNGSQDYQTPLDQPQQGEDDVVVVEYTTEVVAAEEPKEQVVTIIVPTEHDSAPLTNTNENEESPVEIESLSNEEATGILPSDGSIVIVDLPSQQVEATMNGSSSNQKEHVDECSSSQQVSVVVDDTTVVQNEGNDSQTTQLVIVDEVVQATNAFTSQSTPDIVDEDSGVAGKSMDSPIVTSGGSSLDLVPRSISTEVAATIDVLKTPPISVSTSSPRKNPSAMRDENAGHSKPSTSGPKKSAGHMVVDLWTGIESIEFKSDTFLRGDNNTELLTADDVLTFVELGKFFAARIRGNRAEMVAASKILNNLEKLGKAVKENNSTLNVGSNNHNYFRSCMWLGQARLAKFPIASTVREFTEIPIEGIIKLAGYGPDGIHKMGMLPLPEETWREYLDRMSTTSEEKKIKELHGWLERYLGGLPSLLDRKVPRAEGWDSGVSLDVNRCLFRHLENLLLLPPYSAEIDRELTIYKLEKDKTMQVDSGLVTDLVENLLGSPRSHKTASDVEYQPL